MDDWKRLHYHLGKGVGKDKGESLGGTVPKGHPKVPPTVKAIAAPATPSYTLCAHYPRGKCHYGEACTDVHQNADGKTVKTAAPARARSAARTAAIKAWRLEKRAASQDASVVE